MQPPKGEWSDNMIFLVMWTKPGPDSRQEGKPTRFANKAFRF